MKGHDFVYNEWNRGMLVLNDSVFSKQDYLKYDALNDRVLIKSSNNSNEIMNITDRTLTGFSILDVTKNLKHDFVKLNGAHFKDNAASGFYEIIFNLSNTNYFIKKNKKIIFDPNRSKGTMAINNLPLEYKDNNSYYIKNSDGLYANVRLNKKSIKSVLTKNILKVNEFIKINKIKFKSEQDVMKLVNYYYSL